MILHIPLPGCLKFQKIFDNNEYLQEALEQDHSTISRWFINNDCDLPYLKDTLNKANIRFKIKKED
jgi:hypothetical protein